MYLLVVGIFQLVVGNCQLVVGNCRLLYKTTFIINQNYLLTLGSREELQTKKILRENPLKTYH
jgi:hypothetical protein